MVPRVAVLRSLLSFSFTTLLLLYLWHMSQLIIGSIELLWTVEWEKLNATTALSLSLSLSLSLALTQWDMSVIEIKWRIKVPMLRAEENQLTDQSYTQWGASRLD